MGYNIVRGMLATFALFFFVFCGACVLQAVLSVFGVRIP